MEARPQDWKAVGKFFREAWRLAGPGNPGWTGASDAVIDEMSRKEELVNMLTRPHTRIFLAKDKQRVVGFASTKKLDDKTVELSGIIVRQDSIGRGIGGRLLDTARSAAAAGGFKTMTVKTEVNNKRAIRFYRSKGFQATGEMEEDVAWSKKVKLLKLILGLNKR